MPYNNLVSTLARLLYSISQIAYNCAMKKTISFILIIVLGMGALASVAGALSALIGIERPTSAEPLVIVDDNGPIVATVNGIPLPLSHYYLYLRPHVLHFEQTAGGPEIWQAALEGIPTTQLVKEQALESALLVMLTNSQGVVTLTDADIATAHAQAHELFETFTPNERATLSLAAAKQVRQDIILHQLVQAHLTQNYHEDARELVFAELFADWRATAEVIINPDVWERITIGESG